jgi:hypothetical protein
MANKNPTNGDILRKLESMDNTLQATVKDVTILKDWHLSETAARQAVEEYRKEQQAGAKNKAWMEIAKQVGIVLSIVIAILYAYASSKGLHP